MKNYGFRVPVLFYCPCPVVFTIFHRYYRERSLQSYANLSADALQGRYPGTDGDIDAGRYLEEQFTKLGLSVRKQAFSFVQSNIKDLIIIWPLMDRKSLIPPLRLFFFKRHGNSALCFLQDMV